MSDLYRLQVILAAAPVSISRIIQLSANISLNQLHLVLQDVMGWQNSHLYQFEKDGQIWTHPGYLTDDFLDEWDQDEDTGVALCDVLTEVGQTLGYLYDFGDHWQHTIQLITKAPGELNPNQTVLLVDAQGACPPEDVGGIPGYEQMLLAFESGDEEQISEYLNWTNLDNYPHFSYVQVGFMPLLDYLLKHPKGELSSDELIPLLQRWFPELDIETHGDYLEDAFGYRIELIGELFGLCTVSEQPANEYYPFQRRFQVTLLPMARKLLSFTSPVSAIELCAEV